MKNILLWGWSDVDAVMAVKNLNNNEINIVEWIGDTSSAQTPFLQFLYNPPNLGQFCLERHDYELTDIEQIKFLHMFYRESRSCGINFYEQINIAKQYFRYFLWLLIEKGVNHVIFSVPPIIGYDYLCYLAAKRLKIKTTMCYQSLFPDRFFYFNDLENFGDFSNMEDDHSIQEVPTIDWGFKKNLFYMKEGVIRLPPNHLSRFIRQSFRHGLRKSSKPVRYSGVIENYLQAKDFRNYYSIFAKNSSDLDLSEPYVYFPLHLQPELTTTGFGGKYSDQLDAIERISDMIPHGWRVLVKENPKQDYQQRGAEFFRRLSTIKNATYIAKEVDTYYLMAHSQFVATITGTAGWESITGGKPCLVFGLAWYAQIPGVIKYTPTITVDEILKTNIDQKDQKSAFEKMYRKTRQGLVDTGYHRILKDYSIENNSIKLKNFLEEIILKS